VTKQHRMFLSALIVTITFIGGLASCSEGETGPRAWIDYPVDGSEIPVETSVMVISHVYAKEGVARILLTVNGTAYREDPPADPGEPFSDAAQEWFPLEAGNYVLQVAAYDAEGNASNPATVRVRVVGEGTPTLVPSPSLVATLPSPTPTLATRTLTETPVTVTPPPTPTPTNTPTFITVTPMAANVSFWSDSDGITVGECTTLRWSVQNATAVYLDGASVAADGTDDVCPAVTTTYNLYAESAGGDVSRAVTINVAAAADTIPPPIPVPAVPALGLELSCRSSQTLAWLPVDDPSGIAGYDVQLERQVTPGNWELAQGWSAVAGKQVEASVDCGIFYRWRVRAQDEAGNYSAWSVWSLFSVSLI
jgi:hypothetical protein